MGLILTTARRVVEGANIVQAGDFHGWTPTWMLGRRPDRQTAGHRRFGPDRLCPGEARLSLQGLCIHYHNRKPVPARIADDLEATYWESLDQMLARMDVVSVNCPHTPATYHLLSARRLKLLSPHAIVVNTARGEIIDESSLAAMLEAGELAGAGLDVFENEPAVNPKLLKLPNVVLLPHMSLGNHRGPYGHGREGDHQHPQLDGRPQTPGPHHPSML